MVVPVQQGGVMQTQQIPYNGPTNSPVMGSLTNANGGMNWGNLLSDIGTGAGLYAQGSAQSRSASTAQGYANATSQLNPFNATTSGGMGASMRGGSPNLNYGPFNSAYGSLAGVAGSSAGTAGSIQTPNNLSGSLNSAFGSAAGGLGGFTPGAAGYAGNNAFLGAGNAAGMAGQSQDAMMQQYLRSINSLQAPQIQHQTDQLQGTLFGNGQTGSSSGGYLAQQFGQGLATQNTQNSLAAQQLGLQGQQTYANVAGQLGGLGNSLLGSAFNNFSNIAGLPAALQGQYLNNANAGVQGGGAITNQGLGLYNAGLQTSLGQNQASARAGALSTQNANSPNQQSPFGQLASGFFGSQGGQSSLSSLFNQGKQLYNGYNSLFGTPSASAADLYGTPDGMMSPGSISAGYGANTGALGDLSATGYNPDAVTGGFQNFGVSGVPDTYGGPAAAAEATPASAAVDPAVSQGYASLGGVPASAATAASPELASAFSATQAANVADLGAAQMLPSTDAAFGAGASSGASSGATLGAGAGAVAAVLPIAATVMAGQRSSPVVLNSDYWKNMRSSLFSGTSGNATYDANDSVAYQKASSAQQLYSMIQQQNAGLGSSMSGSFNIPPDIMAWAKQQGMLDKGYSPPSVRNNVSAGVGVPGFSTPSGRLL